MSVNRHEYTPHPMYGIRPGFNIADLPAKGGDGTLALDKVVVATTSAAIKAAARSIELDVLFAAAGTTVDILVYTVGTPDVLVKKFSGVTVGKAKNLFVGGFEGFDLAGADLKIRVENFVGGAAAVSVTVKRTS